MTNTDGILSEQNDFFGKLKSIALAYVILICFFAAEWVTIPPMIRWLSLLASLLGTLILWEMPQYTNGTTWLKAVAPALIAYLICTFSFTQIESNSPEDRVLGWTFGVCIGIAVILSRLPKAWSRNEKKLMRGTLICAVGFCFFVVTRSGDLTVNLIAAVLIALVALVMWRMRSKGLPPKS